MSRQVGPLERIAIQDQDGKRRQAHRGHTPVLRLRGRCRFGVIRAGQIAAARDGPCSPRRCAGTVFQRRRRMAELSSLPPCLRSTSSRSRLQLVGQLHAAGPQLDAVGRPPAACLTLAELLQLALVEDGDAVADVLHVLQAVAAHEDRLALLAQLDDQVLHPARAERVEAGGRLVEDDQLRVVDERLGQADALPHALGVFLEDALLVVGRGRPSRSAPAARLRRTAGVEVEQPAVEVERLLGVEEAVEVRFLGQVADAFVLVDVGGGLAEDEGLAVGGEEQAEQQLDGGGLAGAVGAEQAEDFALVDLEVEGVQGGLLLPAPEVAVDLGQVARFDDDFLGHVGHLGLAEVQARRNEPPSR